MGFHAHFRMRKKIAPDVMLVRQVNSLESEMRPFATGVQVVRFAEDSTEYCAPGLLSQVRVTE